ncbi:hypothetical protein A2Z23_03125 [Candidatus Curtissbacteria bacterium RBG_16_39_7]|uniref:Di-trans,poly-cis-decaprenylcistransferase n=1 Tax=Candidatus Curtissbacteria bacterium RBG_16_39_7 TaxID=1797707 RepID=A0A1F5G4B1_9BACT|nr:MAG: hypothetical protein A2Z23_03125 [Candidatus Curtissbacteria bacterium RBG_16_39_7]
MTTLEKLRSGFERSVIFRPLQHRQELVFPPETNLPNHVAVILDGNGTWAEKHGKPRFYGHQRGVQALKRILEQCQEWEIPVLSVWGFSTENWGRDKKEVEMIHRTSARFLRANLK